MGLPICSVVKRSSLVCEQGNYYYKITDFFKTFIWLMKQFEGQNIGQGEKILKKTRLQQEDNLEIAGNETHDDE